MIAAWSDSDSSDSDNEVEQATNLCFMANEENDQEDETKYESSDEVDYSDLLEYFKDELAHALINCVRCEQKYLFKIKSFKKIIHDLCLKKDPLQNQIINLTQGWNSRK